MPVVCDSSQESEVQSLFEQVDREQQGRLDVLVNNAYAGVPVPFKLDSSSTFLTSPSDPGVLIPTHCPFHYPAPHTFLPSDHPTHHSPCAFQAIMKNINKAFWEIPASIWDDINNVGLR